MYLWRRPINPCPEYRMRDPGTAGVIGDEKRAQGPTDLFRPAVFPFSSDHSSAARPCVPRPTERSGLRSIYPRAITAGQRQPRPVDRERATPTPTPLFPSFTCAGRRVRISFGQKSLRDTMANGDNVVVVRPVVEQARVGRLRFCSEVVILFVRSSSMQSTDLKQRRVY